MSSWKSKYSDRIRITFYSVVGKSPHLWIEDWKDEADGKWKTLTSKWRRYLCFANTNDASTDDEMCLRLLWISTWRWQRGAPGAAVAGDNTTAPLHFHTFWCWFDSFRTLFISILSVSFKINYFLKIHDWLSWPKIIFQVLYQAEVFIDLYFYCSSWMFLMIFTCRRSKPQGQIWKIPHLLCWKRYRICATKRATAV